MEEYATAKAILFEGLLDSATAVINMNDSYAEQMIKNSRARILRCLLTESACTISRLTRGNIALAGKIVRMRPAGMELSIVGKKGLIADDSKGLKDYFELPFIGRHNAQNVLCAYGALLVLDVHWYVIHDTLKSMNGVPGRL